VNCVARWTSVALGVLLVLYLASVSTVALSLSLAWLGLRWVAG
jgi:hypothetical protein